MIPIGRAVRRNRNRYCSGPWFSTFLKLRKDGAPIVFWCGLIIPTMSSSPPQRRLEPSDVRLDGQDPYLRVLCVNVFVHDQDRSLRFYVDQLGFNLVIDEIYESGGR